MQASRSEFSATLCTLSAASLAQGRPFDALLAEAGHAPTPYRTHLNEAPLCFLHIPKTAGASAVQVIETMFDTESIFPGFNPPDFELLDDRTRAGWQLFRGHIQARQAALLPPGTELFTILRDPAELAQSMFAWLRQYRPGNSARMLDAVPDQHELRRADRELERATEVAAKLVQGMNLLEVLQSNEDAARQMFQNLFLQALSDTWPSALGPPFPDAGLPDPASPDWMAGQLHKASALLRRATRVGLQDRLGLSLATLAEARGWPAPPPAPVIHDLSRPRPPQAEQAEIRRAIHAASPHEYALYDLGRSRAETAIGQMLAAAGGLTDLREHLDRRYRRRFFDKAAAVLSLDLTADRAWGGTGWGLRDADGGPVVTRGLADGRSASLFVRLEPHFHYILLLTAERVVSMEALEGLAATTGGAVLDRLALNWNAEGSVEVVFEVPHASVAACDGRMVLTIHAPARLAGANGYAVRRVRVQPRHY